MKTLLQRIRLTIEHLLQALPYNYRRLIDIVLDSSIHIASI